MTVLARNLRVAAQRHGGLVAVVDADGGPLTYSELWAQARATAAALRAFGLDQGAVVALDLPSDAAWVRTYAAVSVLGAVGSGINPRFTPPERAAVLDRLQPDLVVDADVLPDLQGRAASFTGDGEDIEMPAPDPARAACVVFTSGTTGAPKGAVFRERQVVAIARIDTGTDDPSAAPAVGPMLASTQFCHIGFMTKLPWYLAGGARIHLLRRWRAPEALRVVAEQRMAAIGGVAAQIGLLLREPTFDDFDLSAVRTIVVGGGPSPAALVREARSRFGAAYSTRWSSTESGGCGTATAFDAPDEEALYTVGRPRPGVDVRTSPSGELELRSPAMMDGYWNDSERTAEAFSADGWLRTGDLAEIDDQGLVRITGRATEMYIRGGYNVHPAEVEAVLLDHPQVAAVAVVPRPDDVLGEIGVAVVVPAGSPPSLQQLREFASSRLARYKLPEALHVAGDLPLTSMDKVDRGALRATVMRPAESRT